MKELRERLEGWTVENCGLAPSGGLRVSWIGDCERRIYERMMGRDGGGVFRALALFEARMHKADMCRRLEQVGVWAPCEELVGFEGRVVGQPEGVLWEEGEPDRVLLVKAVRSDWFEEVERRRGPLNLHFDQAQMYMLLGGFEEAVIVYKSRERGKVFPVYVRGDEEKQGVLREKVERVLVAVDAEDCGALRCTCGRC